MFKRTEHKNEQTTKPQTMRSRMNDMAQAWRQRVAQAVVNVLYGRPVHISPFHSSTVASCVILWYFEGNARRFVMVRDRHDANRARFISCLDAGKHETPSQALLTMIRKVAGDAFSKSIDRRLLDIDRVACAPVFKYDDSVTGRTLPIQSLVWVVQITAEQAQCMQHNPKGPKLVTIPEYALLGPDITQSHRIIYQSALRHIHGQKKNTPDAEIFRELEEMLKGAETPQRILH